jgi:serine/threonine-protein kinase
VAGPDHQALPRIGDRIDRYEICGEIDSGGMAVVYAVKRLGAVGGWSKLLAMKVILPNLARQERFSKMFMDEARILALIQHPGVVQVHDVGETEAGLLYMVMELLRGRSLSRLIREATKTDGTLDRGILLGILADAAGGLDAAHETRLPEGAPARIVHRDVSPQNIHVGFDGTVKVVDFGIAAAEGRLTETRTGELKGKLAYIAPEQVLRRTTDRRADVWSLAVVTWEILAGRRLFAGENEIETLRNVDALQVPAIGPLVEGLPARAADAIMRCLSRTPGERLATAALLGAALREGSRALAAPPEDGADAMAQRRAYVTRLLSTELLIENERLAAAVRVGPPPPFRNLSPEEELSDPFALMVDEEPRDEPPPRPATEEATVSAAVGRGSSGPGRRRLRGAAAVTAALLACLGAWVVARGGAEPLPPEPGMARAGTEPSPPAKVVEAPPAPTPAPARAPPPEAAEPTTSSARSVVLVLDPRIRTVTVGGRVVRERPVRVSLADGPVVVEGESADGEHVRRMIGPDSPDRVALPLPHGEAAQKSKAPGQASPLLGSPYRRRDP